MINNKNLVFVYGTLKRGHGLNSYLTNEEFVGEGSVKSFNLYESGIPFAVPSDNESDVIYGEVYNITNPSVKYEVDSIEVGAGYYVDNVEVQLEDGEKCISQIYSYDRRVSHYTKKNETGVF